MADPAPAAGAVAPALVALGVHVATLVALLALGALDPGQRRLRTYAAFVALAAVWLAGVAAGALGWGPTAAATRALAAACLPVIFLWFALVVAERGGRAARAAVAGLALLAPFAAGEPPWPGATGLTWLPGLWHGVLWTAAAVIVVRAPTPVPPGADDATQARLARARRRLRFALAAIVAAVGALVFVEGGAGAVATVVPLAAAAAQLLVLVGLLRFELYGVARRAERAGAARTGAVAREAAELERLALLGELGATVAHEVRNPLTGIRSVAQRLADGEDVAPERRARFAALIVSEVDRLDRFVGGLLAAARREAAPGEEVRDGPGGPEAATPARALLDDLEALVAARAARADVRLAFAADVATVPAPRGPLTQLLLNLVLNAVAHTPAGGTVRVRVARDADGTHLVVHDAGPGLPAGAALFAPFAPGARGTGLGLAIVRRVADARGWRVRGENAPRGGAVFTLTVPA